MVIHPTQSGVTPLRIAQKRGHSDVVSTLITYGADTIDLALMVLWPDLHVCVSINSYTHLYLHLQGGVGPFDLARSKRHSETVSEVEETDYYKMR